MAETPKKKPDQEEINQNEAILKAKAEIKERMKTNADARILKMLPDEDYIQERVISQSDWHSRKSSMHQKKYKQKKRIEFGLALSIPVLIGFSTMDFVKQEHFEVWYIDSWIQVIAAVAGIMLAFITKVVDLEENYKLWKDYRVISENLDMQRHLYVTRTPPYDGDDAYSLLVTTVERILNENVQQWNQVPQQQKEKEDDDDDETSKLVEKT